MTQEDQNLQSLFANLNQVSRNTMVRERAGGGTGGGSDLVEGTMDPNTLMIGNPYIAKNVVEFGLGGMFDNFGGLFNTGGSGGGAINMGGLGGLGGLGGVGGIPTGAINTAGNLGLGGAVNMGGFGGTGNVGGVLTGGSLPIGGLLGGFLGGGTGGTPTSGTTTPPIGNVMGGILNPITSGNTGSTSTTAGNVMGGFVNPVTGAVTGQGTVSNPTGALGNIFGNILNPVVNTGGNITSGSGDTSSTETSEGIDAVISPVAAGNIVSPSGVKINRGVQRRGYNNKRKFDSGGMYGGSQARPVVSGAPTMNNPYLEKINQLVGLQQMMDVGKGLMRNTLQQEAMTEQIPQANKGMKVSNLSNKERLINLLKVVPNEEAYNQLSKKDQDAFDRTWVKYGGISTKKKRYTNGGRF